MPVKLRCYVDTSDAVYVNESDYMQVI